MVKLLIVNVTQDTPQNRVSDTFTHVARHTIGWGSKPNCDVQSTKAINIQVAYCLRALMLDRLKGTLICDIFFFLSVSPHGLTNGLSQTLTSLSWTM